MFGVFPWDHFLREFVKLPSSWPPARVEGGVRAAVADTTSGGFRGIRWNPRDPVDPVACAANSVLLDLIGRRSTSEHLTLLEVAPGRKRLESGANSRNRTRKRLENLQKSMNIEKGCHLGKNRPAGGQCTSSNGA